MKARLNVALAIAGIAVVMSTGCVSSRKYKASQNALAEMRNDSVKLAQQNASLNQNLHSMEDRNSALQRSLDSSSNAYATQQRSLGYYQDYFSQQQTAMTQVSDELKGALSKAGVSDGDIQQVGNVIYVSLDENAVFKKNSTNVTTNGKGALDGIAEVIRSRSNVNVFVNDGDSSSGTGMGSMSSSSGMGNATGDASDNIGSNSSMPRHHWSGHKKSVAKSGTVATTTPHHAHKRVHRKYSSESGSMVYTSNNGRPNSKYWSLKQRRMGTVANSFLKNGVPRVNVTLRQPDMNSNQQSNTIKVVIRPKMDDFNPQSNSTTSK